MSAAQSWNASAKKTGWRMFGGCQGGCQGELYDVVEHTARFGDELKRAREALGALPDVKGCGKVD